MKNLGKQKWPDVSITRYGNSPVAGRLIVTCELRSDGRGHWRDAGDMSVRMSTAMSSGRTTHNLSMYYVSCLSL